jgi:hypothetical protein
MQQKTPQNSYIQNPIGGIIGGTIKMMMLKYQ